MFTDRLFVRIAVGSDGGVHRLLRYWALGLGLYAVSLSQLWLQAWVGTAPRREVVWLSAASMAGAALAYAAIRASTRLGLSAALLNTGQCLYAIACVIAAYGLVGPLRGVTLCILVVVLVFGAFSSTPFQMRAMSLFAIAALGLTMLWKMSSDPARYPPQEEGVHFVLAATMLAAVGYLAGLLSRLRKELKARTLALTDALARINAMASRDELTQLINRRQMVETLARECERRDRTGEALCVAIIDIDHFKRVNDTQGHAAGDAVLRRFAAKALSAVRRTDFLARWGGEEFLLLLPGTGIEAALGVLERMRTQMRDLAFEGVVPASPITFSAGLIESIPGELADAAIERADRAMYLAKREGRDRIVCSLGAATAVTRRAA